jgi:kinesin family protein 22
MPYVLVLALGYVDPKQKGNGGVAPLSNSNKSMYALMNVVKALNSNQSIVPYRQSKVTRILQDSLCKTSGAVLIACLVSYLASHMTLFCYEMHQK